MPQLQADNEEVSLPINAEFGPPALPRSLGMRHYGSQLWPQLCLRRRYLPLLLSGGSCVGCWRGSCFVTVCWGAPDGWSQREGAAGADGTWVRGLMIDNSYQQKEEWAFSGLVLWGLWGFPDQQKWDLGQIKSMCLQYGTESMSNGYISLVVCRGPLWSSPLLDAVTALLFA